MTLGLFCHLVLLISMTGQIYSSSDGEISIQSTAPKSPQAFQYTTLKNGVAENTASNSAQSKQDQNVDELINDMIKDVEELRTENGELQTSQNNGGGVSSHSELDNCSLPANLDRYCMDISQEVHAYFKLDMTVSGILASLFKKEIVEALQSSCPPGNFCLPNSFHQGFLKNKALFYGANPLCSDEMWKCLVNMLNKRLYCKDEPLNFLVNAINLICDIDEVGRLGAECYARTLEGLYVVFADLTNPAGSQLTKLEKEGCNGFRAQMTATYLCATDACNIYQKPLLEQFETWEEIVEAADAVAATCNISHTCRPNDSNIDNGGTITPNFGEGKVKNNDGYDDYDQLKDILEEIEKETEDVVAAEPEGNENKANEVNANDNDATETNDKTLMVGLIVMTTVFVVGILGLAFFGYRRFCRAKGAYDKCGFSKLIDEESKLLYSEYS